MKTVRGSYKKSKVDGAYAFSKLQLPELIWGLSGVGQTHQVATSSGQKRPR